MTDEVLTVSGLKAYYINELYGIKREVRAVDDIDLTIRRNEIYGLAGESSSGKTSLIKTLAGAIRPPMRVVGGSVVFNFGGEQVDVYAGAGVMKKVRWRNLSYIMQGSMNVLNPVRRVKHSFRDFAARQRAAGGGSARRTEAPDPAPARSVSRRPHSHPPGRGLSQSGTARLLR